MEKLHKIEAQLGDLFKDLPNLPENIKEFLVKFWPYLALIGGVLQLLAAWALWGLFTYSDRVINGVDNLLTTYGTEVNVGYSTMDKTIIMVGIITLAVQAVLLLMAYSPLQKRAKRGWDLLFLVGLINVAYAVIQLFMQGGGVGSALGSLLGSAIGFYLLYQVRPKYGFKEVRAQGHPTTTVKK